MDLPFCESHSQQKAELWTWSLLLAFFFLSPLFPSVCKQKSAAYLCTRLKKAGLYFLLSGRRILGSLCQPPFFLFPVFLFPVDHEIWRVLIAFSFSESFSIAQCRCTHYFFLGFFSLALMSVSQTFQANLILAREG